LLESWHAAGGTSRAKKSKKKPPSRGLILQKLALLYPLEVGIGVITAPLLVLVIILTNFLLAHAHLAAIVREDEPLAIARRGGDYSEVAVEVLNLHT